MVGCAVAFIYVDFGYGHILSNKNTNVVVE